jgi:hypothetical protein
MHIRTEGGGLAAAACCRLLLRSGCTVSGEMEASPVVPFITLQRPAVELIRDIFGCNVRGWEVTRRTVFHSDSTTGSVMPEAILAVDAFHLNRLAWQSIAGPAVTDSPAWTIHTRDAAGFPISSGSRFTYLFEAYAQTPEARESCIFEFTRHGWVYWCPMSDQTGFVQCTLPDRGPVEACSELLDESKLIGKSVECMGPIAGPLPSAARITCPLIGDHTIKSGSAALCFDPLSGSGTVASIRSAILACAVLLEAHSSSRPQEIFEYYAARLGLAFRKHLEACEQWYGASGTSAWDREILSIRQAIGQTIERFPAADVLRFALRDYALIRL